MPTIHRDERIGDAVKELRQLLGLTRPKLAKLMDIHENSIYNTEAGNTNPNWHVICQYASAFGLEPEEFTYIACVDQDDPRRDRLIDKGLKVWAKRRELEKRQD